MESVICDRKNGGCNQPAKLNTDGLCEFCEYKAAYLKRNEDDDNSRQVLLTILFGGFVLFMIVMAVQKLWGAN